MQGAPARAPFFMRTRLSSAPEASVMLQLARLHAYEANGTFHLVDVPRCEAKRKRRELERKGLTVAHTELV